jgi:hypothetical protein
MLACSMSHCSMLRSNLSSLPVSLFSKSGNEPVAKVNLCMTTLLSQNISLPSTLIPLDTLGVFCDSLRVMQNKSSIETGASATLRMSTAEATQRLARIWELGGYSDAAMQIDICKAQSRAWNWSKANNAMQRAYQILGSAAPEVPINAIHNGQHPVQLAVNREVQS